MLRIVCAPAVSPVIEPVAEVPYNGGDKNLGVRPRRTGELKRERSIMTSWLSEEGAPIPLGVTWMEAEQAYNFAIYSKHAAEVTLLLFRSEDATTPCCRFRLNYLKHKSGRIWHCRLPRQALPDVCYYGWSITGPKVNGTPDWHAFDGEKVLLDPYAKAVYFPPGFNRHAATVPGSNAGQAPLGVLWSDEPAFDWSGERRPRHESELIIYEMHVRGYTQHPSSGVPADRRGTFAGVIDKIPHLKRLGVTAVELMPVFQFDPAEGNYWGYMTLNFFSAHQGYCASRDPQAQPQEFKAMVKALHNADIEVILDVVYNHTAEGNHSGPTYSFKGIDSSYYLYSGHPQEPFANYSGTGNTLNCANRYVRRMILDSLRYWVREMHVDGFRFDLASAFARNADGSIDLTDPPIFGEIRADPELGNVRLIAEPWDAAGAYQLGESFPGTRWFQWNGRFRDDVRRFVRGDPGMVPALMFRLYGSDDLFPDDQMHAYHPYQSVNYVSSHDGFTLYDQAAYTKRRNWAHGHHTPAGATDNHSSNCGYEGDDNVPAKVMALRTRQAKNFCCLLFLSNGTPMFLAGDEFLQTQGGNNNPYNQDNETTWLDWSRLRSHHGVFRFFSMMIAFRRAHPTLCRSRFWREDITWYGAERAVDMSPTSRQLAYHLRGDRLNDNDLYVMINGGVEEKAFTIHAGNASQWRRVIDTSRKSPHDIREPGQEAAIRSPQYRVRARSVVVLLRAAGAE